MRVGIFVGLHWLFLIIVVESGLHESGDVEIL